MGGRKSIYSCISIIVLGIAIKTKLTIRSSSEYVGGSTDMHGAVALELSKDL